MTMLALQLVAMLLIILLAAELFTNALEHLGERFHLSQGAAGSVFAAIATALPETTVPLLALLAGTRSVSANEEISTGAILGAPLMLSTLSTCVMGVAALRERGITGTVSPERSGFVRDLYFAAVSFVLAGAAMYAPHHPAYVRKALSIALVATYLVYLWWTLKASSGLVEAGHGIEAEQKMFLARLGLPTRVSVMLLQLALGAVLLLLGAKGFVVGVDQVSRELGVSSLLLSLLIIPIATELPEKMNSVLWIRKRQDTLAFGNITGAMVFQGTLLPAIGITLTPWSPRVDVLGAILITLIAIAWLRINLGRQGVPLWALVGNGVLYLSYLVLTLP